MNVYEQSIVAYALPSLYHIYYLAPVDEEYRVWSWLYQVTILVEERRGEDGGRRAKCDQRNSSGKSLCQKDTATFFITIFDNKTMKLKGGVRSEHLSA